MARYGTFKYGTAKKYGTEANTNLLYALEVDWDEDLIFDGVNEAYGRMTHFRVQRGRSQFLSKAKGGGFARHSPGRAVITLDNSDDRYNPLNTGSALYPNVDKGKYVKFWVRNQQGGTDYPIIAGIVEDIRLVGRGEKARAKLYIEDGLRLLRDTPTNVALAEGITANTGIASILSDVGWPAIWGSDLSIGSDNIPYHWEDRRSAYEAIFDLSEAGIGRFFVANDGKAKYRSRHDSDASVPRHTTAKRQ